VYFDLITVTVSRIIWTCGKTFSKADFKSLSPVMVEYTPIRVNIKFENQVHSYGFLYLRTVAIGSGTGNQVWVQIENSDQTVYVGDASILSMDVLYATPRGSEP
jgi:hypothetical protein